MSQVTATHENVDDLFECHVLKVHEQFGRVTGWTCRACGWSVGAQGLPPSHDCAGPNPPQGCVKFAGGGPLEGKTIKTPFRDLGGYYLVTKTINNHIMSFDDILLTPMTVVTGRYSPDCEGPKWLWRWRGWDDGSDDETER
jgi:hypothetical protein